jgi:hypothetical protein
MFVGHYGPSYLGKKLAPGVPLWVLFLAVQFLDVLWASFVLAGVEKVRIVPGITESNALDLYFMPYTHSLPGAVFWSALAGILWFLFRRSRPEAAVIAAAVFSHWLLDLLVHRPDLALFSDDVKVGLGLWNHKWLAFGAEAAVLIGGLLVYLRSSAARVRVNRSGAIVVVLCFIALQASRVATTPVPGSDREIAIASLAAYLAFALVTAFLDRAAAPVST